MSIGTTNAPAGNAASGLDQLATHADRSEFVDKRIAKVRNQIRSGELLIALMTTVVGLLGTLLFASFVDHWLCDLGTVGRVFVLVVLIGWVGGNLIFRVLPLMIRRVNPAYVAHVIEEETPSIKNSLLGFLFFREHPQELRPVVYEQVERQAVRDLSVVDVDQVVSRADVIRHSSFLTLMFAIVAAYAILSPKSPLQTASRIFAPLADIARPSRVAIRDVQPGTTDIYAGRHLEVSALVDRLPQDETVRLLVTSSDQQLVDQQISMRREEGQLRYRGKLPQSSAGILQDLQYRIVAGDAVAGPFQVNVLPAPSLMVQRVHYRYPEYTQLGEQTVEENGDVVGIEGTRVTITATANQDIKTAYLEFDPHVVSEEAGRKTIPVKFNGSTATARFTLAMRSDGRTPAYEAYHFRFANMDGEKNDDPILHRIQITADLSPEIEILTPAVREIEVPLNGRQPIEVRAIDPDFALSEVKLKGIRVRGEEEVLNASLLDEETAGPVTLKFAIQPKELRLSVGDVMHFWAVAADNRRNAYSNAAAANLARTPTYRLKVMSPDPRQEEQKNGEGEGQQDSQEELNPGRGDSQDGKSQDGKSQDGKSSDKQNSSDRSDDSSSSESPGKSGSESGESEESGKSDQGGSASDQSGGESAAGSDENNASEEESSSSEGGNQQKSESRGGDGQPSEAGGEGSEQRDSNSRDSGADNSNSENARSDDSNDRGSDDGEGDKDGSGDSSPTGNKSPQGGDQTRSGDDTTEGGAEEEAQEPLPSDGSRDGEAIERILDRAKETTGETPDGESGDESLGEGSESPDEPTPEDNRRSLSPPDQSPGGAGQEGQGAGEGQEGQAQDGQGQEGQGQEGQGQEGQGQEGQGQGQEGQGQEGQGQAQEGQGQEGQSQEGQSQEGQGQEGQSQEGQGQEGQGQEGQGQEGQGQEGQGQEGQGQEGQGQEGQGQEGQGQQQYDENDPRSKPDGGGAGGDEPLGDGSQGSGPWNDPLKDKDYGDTQDKANLEYAKRATELALDYLKNRRDKKLLDDLGWTEDDARRFLERWEQLESTAVTPSQDPQGDSTLAEALRSLGLHPGSGEVRANDAAEEYIRGVQDRGTTVRPPVQYREKYEAYLKSLSE